MKSNKLFNVAGSKERLFEMMQKVNKVSLHEGFDNSNDVYTYLGSAWGDLASHKLRVDETNTQSEGNESYVEVIATDQAGTKMRFSFKVSAEQGDQDGVWNIIRTDLFEFTMGYGDEHGISVNSDSQAVKNFNARQQQSVIIDVVSEFADFESGEPEVEPEIDEEYMQAMQKIDSYPFGGAPKDPMVTSQQYGDQKPTNPALRVKSPELNKFVDEAPIVMDNPQTANLGQHYYDKSNPKYDIIEQAIEVVRKDLAMRGQSAIDIPIEEYRERIRVASAPIYADYLARMNEGKKKKKEGDYPNPIGSHFKPKSDYPVEKKKPQTAVNIDEEIPAGNLGQPKQPVQQQFKGEFDLHEKEESSAGIDSIEQDKEENGEQLKGGLGDNKEVQEFDQKQVLMGLKVEMEHTDDPTVALEIVLDHLSEDPKYYTTKDDPEASAQANAACDAEKMGGGNTEIGMSHAMDTTYGTPMTPHGKPQILQQDAGNKEEEDILLGFKPHNVGDEIEETYGTPNPLKIPMSPKQ